MYCERFGLDVKITRHAAERMAQRGICEGEVRELLETGETRYKDQTHLWIAKAFADRDDNLVCAAVVLEDKLVIKTMMHHFQWEP